MAASQTWTALVQGAAPAQNKYMLAMFNGAGSGRIFRLYKVYIVNMQSGAVTGVDVTFEFRFITSMTIGTGTVVTPVTHDTTNTGLPVQLLVATTPQTVGDGSLLRTWHWSSDEAAIEVATQDEIEMLHTYSLFWESGAYDNTNIQPLVMREGEGLAIKCTTNTTVGAGDYVFEFTNDAP